MPKPSSRALRGREQEARQPDRPPTRGAALYLCYFGIREPLVETQVVSYLTELARRGFEIHLLTFDTPGFTAEERCAISDRLGARGIHWHTLRYHRRPSLPATAFDVVIGAWTAWRIGRRHRVGLVHARSHVAAAMASVVKHLLQVPMLFDLRGLLAEEYADFGHWDRNGRKYKLTRHLEKRFYRTADAMVMLTHTIKRELLASEKALRGRDADVTVIPCCVDLDRFHLSAVDRFRLRRQRGWSERVVLAYSGRLGSWYRTREMAAFIAAAHRRDPRVYFNVLTLSGSESLRQALAEGGLTSADYSIRATSGSDMVASLGASDAALCFLEGASTRAASPTKIGEYLALGLPVVTNTWGGDYVDVLRERRLGVVLDEFTEAAYAKGFDELRAVLADPTHGERARSFAEKELALGSVGGARYARIYERLLGAENVAPRP